jgi:UDP:flavonoid glycosyltransferase YjiC (YdhE family)
MHVTIYTLGTLGDVTPYLGLGAGLVARGHRVRLATYERYADAIAAAGLEPYVLPGDPARLMRSEGAQRIARASGRALAYAREQKAVMERIAERARLLLDAAVGAADGTDLIVYSLTAVFGASIAESRGLPAVQAFVTPVTPTRAFPHVLSPRAQARLGGLGNYASHLYRGWLLARSTVPLQNAWRRESLGLPPMPVRWPAGGGPLAEARHRRWPLLYGISPTVLPRPADWGDEIEMTGFWPQPLPDDWMPPPDLEAFLAAGDPPVCIGFSSAGGADGARMTTLVLDAVEKTGRRAVLLSGWGALEDRPVPASVHVAEQVPHAWLAPRVAAMVHAGGVGTAHAVFAAGVPSLVVPFTGDQFFWARRAVALGTGPAMPSWWTLTAASLADGIDTALREPAFRAAARDVADRMAGEDGVARAVAAIERTMARAA